MKSHWNLAFLALPAILVLPTAHAATCSSESQMQVSQRDTLANAVRGMAAEIQQGNVQALQAQTIPAVASNFGGIAATINRLKPLVQSATITIDDIYYLDASAEAANAPQTQFFCGTRIVALTFQNLPPGKYALAIVHATGVPNPQQMSLILSENPPNHWMLAGFLAKPMVEAGHSGIWYWEHARNYASRKQDWAAWFYYQTAADLLRPAPFVASPNLQKLDHEMNAAKPPNLPGATPMMLSVNGSSFEIMSANITTTFGTFDLEVQYQPSTAQLAALHDPTTARSQVVSVMTALLTQYPELRSAFHGIWVRANQGNSTVFALDLPMNQIPSGSGPPQA
ncbi:MAG TPA: hypothetical protein VGT04_10695 [Acidobacteriaceae bacterium]|nr:hypothetical protein [Acidobacteriaceae bacterium]